MAFLTGASLRQEPAEFGPLDPWPEGERSGFQGSAERMGRGGADEALRNPDSSCSMWGPITLMLPEPRKTEKGYGLERAVSSI